MPQRRDRGCLPLCFDHLIVGAGFAGTVLAERLASRLNRKVLLIDRRQHVGGNAADSFNSDGILVHCYGPHIFHTNSRRVASYLSRFTRWRPYEHRVLAEVDGMLVPFPINLTTLNRLYGLKLSPAGARAFLAERADALPCVRTLEEVVVSTAGRDLYEKFFEGYTRKQWGLDPSQLDKTVARRVATRIEADDRYFRDSFQFMPLHGFSRMFETMLDHPNITVMLNTDYRSVPGKIRYQELIYTGRIDEFFDYRFGVLPYRSLRFRHETLVQEWFQPVAVINYPSKDIPYTRVTEYKHLTGQTHAKTSISYEYPAAEGDPFYPIPRAENVDLFRKYRLLADQLPHVHFLGRLASYRYYNMDQVVGQALALFERIARASGHPPEPMAAARSEAPDNRSVRFEVSRPGGDAAYREGWEGL
jgi:UDP-galactopyranose mutase